MSPPHSRRSTQPGTPSSDLTREIRVAVVEEHEILRHGLVASLAEDQDVRVTSTEHTELGEDIDVAVVSDQAARQDRFPCPIVVCSDGPDVPVNPDIDNDVAGLLHNRTLTVAQLRATVHAAAAGLRVNGYVTEASPRPLNERERRVIELIADGYCTREIAESMCYSERTIKKLITSLHESLQARTRAQIVAHAIRRGLI